MRHHHRACRANGAAAVEQSAVRTLARDLPGTLTDMRPDTVSRASTRSSAATS